VLSDRCSCSIGLMTLTCAAAPTPISTRVLPAARSGGRPRKTCLRRVMNAVLYIASSGGAWRMMPRCFLPVSTVRGYFYAWRNSGLLAAINHILVMAARQQAGREASPSAGVIDSQSVKTWGNRGFGNADAVELSCVGRVVASRWYVKRAQD
jgi:transposase